MGVDLGTRLQHAGLLTRESLERLLAVLDRSSRSFVDVLLAADEVDEDALVGFFLAEGYGPLVPRDMLVGRGMNAPKVPREMCEALGALPYGDLGDAVVVAMVDPSDMHALAEVGRALARPVRPHVVRASDLRAAIEHAFAPAGPAVAPLPAPRRVGEPSAAEEPVVERGHIVRAPSEPPHAPVVVELVQRRIPDAPALPRSLVEPDRPAEGLGGLKVATRPIPLVHPTERRSAVPGLLSDEDDGEVPIALTHRKTPPPDMDEAPIELSRPSRTSVSREAATFPSPPVVSREAATLPPASVPPRVERSSSGPDVSRPAVPPARPFAQTIRTSGATLGAPTALPQATPRALRSTLIGNPSDSTPPSPPTPRAPAPTRARPDTPPAAVAAPPAGPTGPANPLAATVEAPRAPPGERAADRERRGSPDPTAIVSPPSPERREPPPSSKPSARAPSVSPSSSVPASRKRMGASGEHWVLPPAGPFPARDQLARPSVPSGRDELRRTDPDIARAGATSDLGSLLAIMRTARDRDAVVAAALDALMTTARRSIFLVVKREVLQGWDGRGPLISTDALRNLWIPVSSPSIFRDIVEAGAVYRGPPGVTTADAIFLTAVAGRPEEIILQPVVVRGRVVGVLYCEDPAYGRAASERAEVIARACCDAFERIILAGR